MRVASGVAYDSIYVSSMLRTQQTAEASESSLGLIAHAPLDGFREISAGIFEGSPEDSGIGRIGYIVAPLAWTLGLRFVRIPGSENGNEFDARVDGALDQIDADGNSNAVVFSHGATIMFWTMMNVDNPNLLLIVQQSLDNTDVVVVESNGEGGWTLEEDAAGTPVAPANYPTQMFVNVRDLIVAPQTAVYNFRLAGVRARRRGDRPDGGARRQRCRHGDGNARLPIPSRIRSTRFAASFRQTKRCSRSRR